MFFPFNACAIRFYELPIHFMTEKTILSLNSLLCTSERWMSEHKKVKCQICGCEIDEENSYVFKGAVLCEDCHMEETHPVVTCDPKAVHSAKVLSQANKPTAKDGLDDLQKALYKFVTDKGKVTLEEICGEFNLSPVRAQNQLAILRHLELTKGKKEADNTYIIPF